MADGLLMDQRKAVCNRGGATQADTSPGAKRAMIWTRVIEHERLTRRPGYLLSRAESPWALIDVDYYEAILQ